MNKSLALIDVFNMQNNLDIFEQTLLTVIELFCLKIQKISILMRINIFYLNKKIVFALAFNFQQLCFFYNLKYNVVQI